MNGLSATLTVAGCELRLRMRDRSLVVMALVGPLVLSLALSLLFGGSGQVPTIGIAATTTDATIDELVADGDLVLVDGDPSAAVDAKDVDAVIVLGRDGAVEVISHATQPAAAGLADAMARRIVADPDSATAFVSSPAESVDIRTFFGPAIAMTFALFIVGLPARAILTERQTGTLARMLAAPIPTSSIVAGKALVAAVIASVTHLVVWIVLSVLLGVEWGPPLAVGALLVAAAAAFAGIGMLLGSIVKTDDEAAGLMTFAALGLAMLGGNFFPPDSLPDQVQAISRLTPNGLGLHALTTLAAGGPASSALGAVVGLLSIAAVTGIIGGQRSIRGLRA